MDLIRPTRMIRLNASFLLDYSHATSNAATESIKSTKVTLKIYLWNTFIIGVRVGHLLANVVLFRLLAAVFIATVLCYFSVAEKI